MKNGIVRRVTGPVVDVQFPTGHLPDIYNAIEIQLEDRKVVMEAMQQLGSDTVRCVSLFSTDGIARGCTAVDTGSPVTMPVGEATLGRMFNVVGDPIDGKGPVEAERMPIHGDPGNGHQGGGPAGPIFQGRQDRPVRRRRRGKNGAYSGAYTQRGLRARRLLRVCRRG